MVLRQNASERVRRHYEASSGVGCFAQLLRAMESALVPINAESEDVTHVRIRLHGADKDHIVPGGEGGELVTIPGTGVFGDA